MRSIPFAVVALVGMGSGSFPRQDRAPAFDRMARNHLPGDRSLQLEDRYLFLEALLSARKAFYVSFPGQSMVDNSPLPPSPLVSELMDAVSEGFLLPGQEEGAEGDAGERLVARHKLQPFHPAYFGPDGEGEGVASLFSYSGENCRALRSREEARRREPGRGEGGGGSRPAPFLEAPLPPPDDPWRRVTLSDLKRFLSEPVKFFLQERLGVTLRENPGGQEDHEPFSLDALESYLLGQELLEWLLAGGDEGALHESVRRRGLLPPGVPGDLLWEESLPGVRAFAARVEPLRRDGELPPVAVRLEVGPFHLSGTVRGIRPGGLLRYRCAKVKAKDLVSAWVDHLALSATDPAAGGRSCRLVGTDGSWLLRPAADPRAILERLLELYRDGLSEPLPLFPRASFAYAETLWGSPAPPAPAGDGGAPAEGKGAKGKGRKGKKADEGAGEEALAAEAMGNAASKWFTNEFAGFDGEDRDRWNGQAFGETEEIPGGARFADLAERLYRELFAHREAEA